MRPAPAVARAAPPVMALLRAVAVLLLVAAPILGAAAPAGAVEAVTVTRPVDGVLVEGPLDVVVEVTAAPGEVVERVEVTLTGPGERTAALAREGDGGEGVRSTWTGTVDPLAGLALPNGDYRLAATARPVVGEAATAEERAVRLAVPPPRRALEAAPVAEDPTRVALTWDAVALPDFRAYRLQRRPDGDGGTWQTVAEVEDPRVETAQDAVPEPGRYRYRLIVVRGDGQGGELFAASPPQGVRADPADPGTFPAPPEPEPRPANTPEPTPTPAPTATTPPAGGTAPPPPVTVRPPPAPAPPAPSAPAPAVVPLEQSTFSELLPFDLSETEIVIEEPSELALDGPDRPSGGIAVLTEDPPSRAVWTAIASGLLLVVVGAHLQRFLAGGRRRRT